MKRFSPTWIMRTRSGFKAGFGAFIVAVGVSGAIVGGISATDTRVPLPIVVAFPFACAAIGTLVAYIRGRFVLLPDSLVDEMSADGRYTCTVMTRSHLREACEMSRPYYGHEYVAADQVEQWRQKNPSAFLGITNAHNELCAGFGIIGLVPSFMDFYVAGKLQDTQIDAINVCSANETKQLTCLYISGVIVRDSATYIGRKRAFVLLWAILTYIHRSFGLEQERELFALAVTKESERLMKHIGFELACPANRRVDRYNLFKFRLTRKSWTATCSRIGDLSAMCEFCD